MGKNLNYYNGYKSQSDSGGLSHKSHKSHKRKSDTTHIETSKSQKPRQAVNDDNQNYFLDSTKLFCKENSKAERNECLVNKKTTVRRNSLESELERTLRKEKARLKRKKVSLLKAFPTMALPVYSRSHGTWKSGMSRNSFPLVKVKIEPVDTTIDNEKVNPVEKKKSSRKPQKVIWRFSDGTVIKKN